MAAAAAVAGEAEKIPGGWLFAAGAHIYKTNRRVTQLRKSVNLARAARRRNEISDLIRNVRR